MHRRFLWLAVPASLALALLALYAAGFLSLNIPSEDETLRIDGSSYSYMTVPLSIPPPGQNATAPIVVVYENATFTLWFSSWREPSPKLRGTLEQLDGSVSSFFIPAIPSPDPWKTWISPDGLYGVQWTGTALEGMTDVRLLAKV